MGYISFIHDNKFRWQPSGLQIHKDATNIQEFLNFADLEASDGYQANQLEINEGLTQNEVAWQAERDKLIQSPIIFYGGDYYSMDSYSRSLLADSKGALESGVILDWKVQSSTTGEKHRVKLSIADLQKIETALTIAVNEIHLSADTGMPINPWPLLVE